MDFVQYITQNALILIPVLYILGTFLKNTTSIQDWLIPWILTALGIIGGLFLVEFNINGIIQGILVAGVTVLGNQLLKQTLNKS